MGDLSHFNDFNRPRSLENGKKTLFRLHNIDLDVLEPISDQYEVPQINLLIDKRESNDTKSYQVLTRL